MSLKRFKKNPKAPVLDHIALLTNVVELSREKSVMFNMLDVIRALVYYQGRCSHLNKVAENSHKSTDRSTPFISRNWI